jgi:CRISPR-associated protein (TIGR02710 family)
VLDALQLDLDALRPDYLAMIASGQSMANARRMIERSHLPAECCEIIELASANDIDEIFGKTNQLIQRLVARGFAPGRIAINYTSGTKVMGAGAVLSAVYNNIMELRYITGLTAIREGGDPTRHRIVTTRPSGVFAFQQMIGGRQMLLNLLYRSAESTLDGIDEEYLSPANQHLLADLGLLTRAYGEWDNFYPDRFMDLYREVSFEDASLEIFRMGPKQLEELERLTAEIKEGKQGPHVITDLYNNGHRRLTMGRTEDAMARLYRALEMLAQWVLMRDHGIDTNDVDTRLIPPRDRVSFEAQRSIEDGMVKIGLRKAYDLLVILGSPVGRHFKADPAMRHFLEQRAESMLAHGIRPTTRPEAQEFMDHARDLFAVEIVDFNRIGCALQFPWLRGSAAVCETVAE